VSRRAQRCFDTVMNQVRSNKRNVVDGRPHRLEAAPLVSLSRRMVDLEESDALLAES